MPDIGLSVCVYPIFNQGKPVNIQERHHSINVHAAGITSMSMIDVWHLR